MQTKLIPPDKWVATKGKGNSCTNCWWLVPHHQHKLRYVVVKPCAEHVNAMHDNIWVGIGHYDWNRPRIFTWGTSELNPLLEYDLATVVRALNRLQVTDG